MNEMITSWVHEELGAIISSLRVLVRPNASGGNRTAFFVSAKPRMQKRAAAIISTESYKNGELADSMGKTTAQLILMDAGTGIVLQQQALDFPLAPTVVTDQAVLATTCRHWDNDYRPVIMSVLVSIGSTALGVQNLMSNMLSMNANEIEKCLNMRRYRLLALRDKVRDAITTLTDNFIRLDLDKDGARFDVTQVKVENEYNGTNGRLAEISQEISILQDQIDAFNASISEGVTGALVKIVGPEIVFSVGVMAGSVPLPAVAAGASELEVMLYKGSSAALSAGSKAVQAKAKEEYLPAIGGKSGEEAQEEKIVEMPEVCDFLSRLN